MLMNKVLMSKLTVVSCAIGFLASTVSVDANANYTHRSDKWEASFKVLNSQSADINGQNDSTIAMKSDYGWGFTFGYNLNPHILINFDFSSTTPSYEATLVKDNGSEYKVNHKMNLFDSQFNVVYSVFASQLTPYVQAGAGWSYLDSNIADGPPNTVCWYDPWWGYICEGYQSTYNDTRFSYNVAAGFRYELDNSLFFRASYKQSWIDLSHSSDASIGSYHLEIGSIF
ncbi:outer membrane beta-barrel protein [Colwellia ponticola]|uniref:Porin family protein n=1 Tax=Colwellia ponticola TaxID=2304625 RepID=A0A8H2JLW0_9GAMM|nr:outer membrane beta-barrel protein [Colwellia ponticola]TMM46077.1 porin family protein [Colwellia ponticola]